MKRDIKVTVCGAGKWGRNHVKNFAALEALGAVVEPTDSLREELAAEYPGVPFVRSLDEVRDQTTAVVLATPAPTHFPLAAQAIESGLDVLVEKPMTLAADESRRLVALAQEHNRILMVGHLLLFQRPVAWMRDHLASGKAGRVLRVMARRAKLGRVRRAEDVWWSFAPHDVSVVLELLGRPQLHDVQATGHAMLQPGISDDVHVEMRFAGGASAHIHASWLWPEVERRTVVVAEKQMLVYDELAGKVTVYDKSIDPESLQMRDEGSEVHEFEATNALRVECEHFLECVTERKRPIADGDNGVAVVDILERAGAMFHGE